MLELNAGGIGNVNELGQITRRLLVRKVLAEQAQRKAYQRQ